MPNQSKLLFATDMDGTVIPLDRRPRRTEEIAEFCKEIGANGALVLAYVTGRHFELALNGQREHRLPIPDLLVCDVGTSIYCRMGKRWIPDETYRQRMRKQLGGRSGDEITAALEGTLDLIPQEDEKQSEFKRSYYVSDRAEKRKVLARVRRRLTRNGIRASLVDSVDPEKGVGLLDVLPRSVAKDFALHYLQRKLRLPMDRVLYAGDSGNDLLAFASGFKAIVVGNTPPEVRADLDRMIRRRKQLAETIYFARHRYANVVVEGVRHFGAFPAKSQRD